MLSEDSSAVDVQEEIQWREEQCPGTQKPVALGYTEGQLVPLLLC